MVEQRNRKGLHETADEEEERPMMKAQIPGLVVVRTERNRQAVCNCWRAVNCPG